MCEKTTEMIIVSSVPGVAYSAGYCSKCFEAGAHPLPVLISNTALMGGIDNCHEWWNEMIDITLAYLGKTKEWFNSQVARVEREDIEQLDASYTAYLMQVNKEIKETSYFLWEKAGKPIGRDLEFWIAAEEQVRGYPEYFDEAYLGGSSLD